jgi:hypothetical protein
MDASSNSVKGIFTPTLPTFPPSSVYDPELDSLCRLAAWIGARAQKQAPVSFSTLMIALMVSDDHTSKWFRHYVDTSKINRRAIFAEKGVPDSSMIEEIARAQTKELPESQPLFTQSVRNILTAAAAIATSVANNRLNSTAPLGIRHVLAAYAFRTPSDHVKQLLGHGFDFVDWQTKMMAFLRQQYLGEHWNRLVNANDGPNPSEMRPEDDSPEVFQNSSVFSGVRPRQARPRAPTNVNITPGSGSLNVNTPPSAGTTSASTQTKDSDYQSSPDSGSISLELPNSVSVSEPNSDPSRLPPQPQTVITGPLVGRYTADDPYATADDLLDIESEASAFARIVAARSIRPPLAIGIFGEWGSGKTYFMRRIQSQVDQLRTSKQAADTGGLFYSDIVQIRFNAWHYIETNLWASLVEYIFAALDTWIQQKASGDQKRTDLIFNRLATAQQLQIDALENVVKLRAQQHSAELRAQRARQDYADALAKSTRVKPDAYVRAMLRTFLEDNPAAKEQLETIGKGLAIPQLESESERLTDILAQARSEAGRAKLVTQSLFSKIGTWPGIVAIAAIVFALPGLTVLLKALAEHLPALGWIKNIHDANIQIAIVLLAATGIARFALARVRAAVKKLVLFDQELQKNIDKQVADVNQSAAVKEALASNQSLLKSKQAVDTAERALLDANAKLASARQEFESGTARGRLNAFVRAKVTDGDYAKHLGIIASIRKDFVQLASLMSEANDSEEERRERLRLREESRLRVRRFLNWLNEAAEVRLTLAEVRSLFTLLDPADAVCVFDEYFTVLENHFDETAEELRALNVDLRDSQSIDLPRFSRIVLYIDDLDRCPPAKVVDVLQAVHLLLCFPLFVVIVAVDARWVSRALHERFPGLLTEISASGPLPVAVTGPPSSGATSDDYLEKIFQIPYWVRPMEAKAAANYVQKIAGSDRQTSSPQAPEPAVPPVVAAAAGPSADPGSVAPETPPIWATPTPQEDLVQPRSPSTAAPPAEPVAVGMTLTDWEIDALNAFAPFVGRTPRHAIRFVNVYRLIKTSLSLQTIDTTDLEQGINAASRALIPQLAIVTGATAAQEYFRDLQIADGDQSVKEFIAKRPIDGTANSWIDDPGISGVFATLLRREASANSSAVLKVKDLLFMAPTVQRFSFTARLRESKPLTTT